ncbi:IclR family transcriptional regulator [Cognatishimia activa]|uniref:IclR family transcriptional regulator n=1 Tax=Cognatishimia activa TaxID=1715691 RepID=UPI002230F7DC|nr:IclR family transcriptional regulator [Cognatishimia activa]UZD90397.1 IclR family transcriptional regulator [Cognatishimia activa]
MSTVQSVRRAFSILQSLSTGPSGVSEIAIRTELPKSTVARLLATLVEVGAVEQNEALGTYGLGKVIAELSPNPRIGQNLIPIVRPYLTDLVEEIGEAAGLGVLEDGGMFYYDQVASQQEVQVRNWTGERVDAHVTSSGIILLAHADDAIVTGILDQPLKAWTENSTIDPELLRRRLDVAKTNGFAWCEAEMSDELNSVAAPIFNASGAAIAAIHAHGPSYRFPGSDKKDSITEAVMKTAQRVSSRLMGRYL